MYLLNTTLRANLSCVCVCDDVNAHRLGFILLLFFVSRTRCGPTGSHHSPLFYRDLNKTRDSELRLLLLLQLHIIFISFSTVHLRDSSDILSRSFRSRIFTICALFGLFPAIFQPIKSRILCVCVCARAMNQFTFV